MTRLIAVMTLALTTGCDEVPPSTSAPAAWHSLPAGSAWADRQERNPSCFEFNHDTTRTGRRIRCRMLLCGGIHGGPATLWCDEVSP